MSRLIDADRLCEDLLNRWSIADTKKEELIRQVMADVVTPIVVSQPTIEQQKGKWIKDQKRFGDDAYHCDQCGAVLEKDDIEWRNNYYCYHCGSCMKGN